MKSALLRYQVMSYVVGVMLLLLVLVAMPLHYLADRPTMSERISPVHGALYMVYLVVAFDLGMKAGWTKVRILLVLLAGAVPFLSFWVERKVTEEARARLVTSGS